MTHEKATTLRPVAGQPTLPVFPDVAPRRSGLKVGVLTGLGYRNMKGDLERFSHYLEGTPVPHHIVRQPHDVATAFAEFEAAGIDVVAVSGGDGTIGMAITHILNRRRSMPLLALLEGGRTNMTARDIGLRGDQIARLHRLLTWAEQGALETSQIIQRPIIGVTTDGGEHRECGFFVGGGAVYQGSLETWKQRDRTMFSFMRTGIGTAASVVDMMRRHLVSRSAFKPARMRIKVDGVLVPHETWCVLLVSSLESLAFGINPFWGSNGGRLHLTAITSDHRHLLRAAVSGLRGAAGRHNTEALGYYSLNGERIEIDLDDGVTLDGQLIRHKGPGLELSVAGTLRFLRV